MAIQRSLTRSASTASMRTRSYRPAVVRVLVGPDQQQFLVDRTLLCASSAYFQDQLSSDSALLWLSGESPAMFELFSIWLHHRETFRKHLDEFVTHAAPPAGQKTEDSSRAGARLHWALVRLHLFAANLDLHSLQDAAMDAVQDLYLRRDWDVTPRFIRFLYAQCDGLSSLRLRRWAVAMVALSLSGGGGARIDRLLNGGTAQFRDLFDRFPDFTADYATHIRKMEDSGLDVRVKNPQLRIPANKLRNEQRRFAFRQCAFHTHRAAVGERKCPHAVDELRSKRLPLLTPLPEDIRAELQVIQRGFPEDVPRPLRRMKSIASSTTS